MSAGILKRIKESVVGSGQDDGLGGAIDDSGVDLESGTITIEEVSDDEIVTTGDVLREGFDHESEAFFKGFTGTVFVLDISPIYNVIGTLPNSRIGASLVTFAETLLHRELHGIGTFKNHGDAHFFFRLNKDDAEGWNLAAMCVNEIGEHFLRDRYKPDDMLPLMVAAVEEGDLKGKDGEFKADYALERRKNQVDYEASQERKQREPEWEKLDRKKLERLQNREWQEEAVQMRAALDHVSRGPDRRKIKANHQGVEQRKQVKGRRDLDNPKQQVW